MSRQGGQERAAAAAAAAQAALPGWAPPAHLLRGDVEGQVPDIQNPAWGGRESSA